MTFDPPNSLIGINHVVKGMMHSTGGIQVKEAGEKEGREVEEKLSVLLEKRKKKLSRYLMGPTTNGTTMGGGRHDLLAFVKFAINDF